VTLLVTEKRIKDNGVRINNKIASIKDILFDTFKNGKNDNLIQIRRSKLFLKGSESSLRRYVEEILKFRMFFHIVRVDEIEVQLRRVTV
jgi:hypothetical protein